ncbi:hypothetical protein [Dokdonella soli]|uniref:Uncharacterized protein n=1 Tax=Dokdonella soli TaxID=529810 RepID=A0ABP3TZU2_9GAMM
MAAAERYPHPPGAPEAVADGCTCPILDNARGKGCGYLDADGHPCFIVTLSCPHHGEAACFADDVTFARDLSEPAYGAAARLTEKIA